MTTRLALAVALIVSAATGAHAPAAAEPTRSPPPSVTDTVVGSCVFHRGASHCVRQYRYGDRGTNGIQRLREPSEQEIAESRERERRWVARCRPHLRPDAHGVNRYVYAAPGCEYGQDRD
jgi:hypothetical protein